MKTKKNTKLKSNLRRPVCDICKFLLMRLLQKWVPLAGILFVLSAMIFISIIPVGKNFEGNILSKEMSFVYDVEDSKNGKNSKLLIKNIENIQEFGSEGIQTLELNGEFRSESLPKLNRMTYLRIELPSDDSKWIIKQLDSNKNSDIILKELRIEENTKINGLKYDFKNQQLSFDLDLKRDKPEPDFSKLNIGLGGEPIEIKIENCKISGFDSPFNNLNFTYTPDSSDLMLKMKTYIKFDIFLNKKLTPDDLPQFFKSNIDVKDVEFIHFDKHSNSGDDVNISTILKGTVRMADQQREIQENQFLMGQDRNHPLNIKRLVHLKIVEAGIEARFSGQTNKLQIGLDPELPISAIQGSLLDGILPRDLIIAIFALGAGAIASLIPGLFDSSQSQSKQENLIHRVRRYRQSELTDL